jgi:predicted pyridoxine 5'-phosphate oxidase superfamily flavin-nucleotide-binding protein
MTRKYTRITFTDSVKEAQEHYGSRTTAQRVEEWDMDDEHLSENEREFISKRDGFYMATVNGDGWPYLQFRGGPRGFLKVLDDATLAYADFRGNRQYISTGNARANDRVALFFMDYATQRRLKVMARAEIVDADDRPDLLERVALEGYRARVERVVQLHVVAFDWNCPQHITPRFTRDEFRDMGESAE